MVDTGLAVTYRLTIVSNISFAGSTTFTPGSFRAKKTMVQPPPPPADADAPAPLSDEEYESDQAGGDAELEEEEVSQETMDNDDGEECNGSSLLLQVVLLVRAHLLLSLNLKMTMMMVITMVMIKLLESRRGAKELVEGDHVHPLPR